MQIISTHVQERPVAPPRLPVRDAWTEHNAWELRMHQSPSIYLSQSLERLIGRRALWRVGRLLYRHARRDGLNDPAVNGEFLLHRTLARLAAEGRRPLRAFDIGANAGDWSFHLLNTCRSAGVQEVCLWSFEPSDETRALLIERLKPAQNGYQVKIRREALADEIGAGQFDASSGSAGTKSLLAPSGSNAVPRVEVPVTTLVAVFEEEGLRDVDFVKSDVEGFDLKVISGALPLLRDGRIGLLQFEYNHRWLATRSFLRDVFDLAETLRYHVCKIVPDGLERHEVWHPEMETFFEANFALVRDDLLTSLNVRRGAFDVSNTYALASRQNSRVA